MKGILYIIILLSALPGFSVRAQVVPPSPAQPGSQTGQQIGTPGGPQNKQQTPSQIGYGDVRITRSGEYVDVSFEVMAGRKSVKRGEQLILTPVLFNDSHKVPLPTIVVQSRRAELQAFRAGKRSASPHTPAYATRNGGKIQYSTRIPYMETLTDVFLGIERKAQRCGRASSMSAIMLTERAALVSPAMEIAQVEPAPVVAVESVADSLSKRYLFIAPIADFERSKQAKGYKLFDLSMPLNMGKGTSEPQQSAVEQFVANNEKGAIQINFSRNSSTIDRYFAQNNPSLVVLASALKEIQSSENSQVEKIVVAGFASPEGPLAANDRLAWERADAVRTFIRNNSTVPFKDILLYNGSEDWRGLRDMVEQSQIEAKYEILYIIDNVPIEKGREKQLMDLAGGRPYKFMARYFFPKLRNAAYIKVYYTNTGEIPAAE